MSPIPGRFTDPRDNLQQARLIVLQRFAAKNGIEIPEKLRDSAIMIRQILRERGLTRIAIVHRPLDRPGSARIGEDEDGFPSSGQAMQQPEPTTVQETDAEGDLRRQLMAAPQVSARPRNEITELRKECKAKGIKISRTDKKPDLRAKLDGQNAT